MQLIHILRSKSVKAHALATASTLAIATYALLGGPVAYGAEAQSAASLEEIVVTGSRIAREGYEAPTPLSVMNIQALEDKATANIADALKDMAIFNGSATPTSQQGGVSAGNAGTNVLNIRSLGAGRSLILLDGHRTVGSNADGAVDLNTFPQMLVARVDVVTGGVSAVYGSDAVAGVANFILDKTYTGIKGELSGGVTSYGDDKNYKIGLAAGFDFAGGRGHVLISGEENQKEGILNGSNGRQWDLDGTQTIQNPAYVSSCAAGSCQPFYISSNQIGMSTTAAGGIITAGPLKGTAFGPGGVPYQFAYGSTFSAPLMIGGQWKTQQTAPFYSSLDNKESRQAVFLRVAYDVADNVNVYAQASWNHVSTFGTTLPRLRQGSNSTNSAAFLNNTAQPYVTGGPASGLAPGVPFPFPLTAASNQVGIGSSNIISLGLKVDNAHIPDEVRARIPAGTTLLQIGSWTIDLPLVSTENEHFVNRNVLGATGNFDAFGTGWGWDLYFQHGYSRNSTRAGGGITNEVKWAQAVDAVRSPTTGRIVCRSTLTNPNDGCVPFNVLGIGVNSQAAIDYVTILANMYQRLTQNVWAGTLTGEPFDLWAGPVSLALNVEHRVEKITGVNSNDDEYNNTFSGNYHATIGSNSVTEGAIELIVPLAKGESWADSWDLSLAARATNYRNSGFVMTWKAGTTYRPIPDMMFRVTRSRDIRAPNLAELFLPSSFGRGNAFDVFSGTTHQINNFSTGNPNLKPEKADMWGIGGVVQPAFLPGFSFSADYWQLKTKDGIGSVSGANTQDLCFRGDQYYCDRIVFNTPGTKDFIVSITTSGVNLTSSYASGIDFAATYRTALDEWFSGVPGTLTLNGDATLNIKRNSNNGLTPPTGINTVGSNESVPYWKGSVSATYNADPIRVGLTARIIPKGKQSTSWIVCDPGTCPVSTTDNRTISSVLGGTLTGEANVIPGAIYIDFASSYKFVIGEETTIEAFLNIKNIANSDPVVIPIQTGTPHSAHPANSGLYDVFGRVFRVGLRFSM